MRKSAVCVLAVAVAASFITACSPSKDKKESSLDVGVILPDTTSSTRYTLYDAPLLKKAFTAAGVKYDVQNAQGSNSTFVSIAQQMINQGVKVLVIDPADPTTGITVEKTAADAGVKVIDYDRVNLGGSAQYYVSFDNEAVGKLQAQTLLSCIQAAGTQKAYVIEMNGGTDIDNNAVLFKAGAHEVLDPLYANGTLVKGPETDVSKWDNAVATTDFQQALVTSKGQVDAVLAANDGIAASVIGVLNSRNLTVPVSGQDSTIQGLQYVLTGKQCMTIFKDVSKEADAAAKLAIALIKGDDAAAKSLTSSVLKDPKNGRSIPSLLLPAEAITKANVEDVVKAGALTAAEICKGIETACTANNVS